MSRRPRPAAAGRALLAVAGAAAWAVSAAPVAAQEPELAASQRRIEDRAAALATVRALLRALGARDLERIEALHLPQALTVVVQGGGAYPTVRALPEVLDAVGDVSVPMVERIWDPEVRVSGDLAAVWAPYDFYVGGSFSHCGEDAFHLVRAAGDWRIAAVSYTIARPPLCELHPDGPPPGAGPAPAEGNGSP